MIKNVFEHGLLKWPALAVGLVWAGTILQAHAGMTLTKAAPRDPWDGKVDFTFTITGDGGVKYATAFSALDVVGGTNLTMNTVTRRTSRCDGNAILHQGQDDAMRNCRN